MPSKNIIKPYVENGYYHIYNRGVAKQDIFLNHKDYYKFTKLIIEAVGTPLISKKVAYVKGRTFDASAYKVKNFENNLSLIAYCLMPNHFHFLIKQTEKETIQGFMRSIITRYAAYFNKRYDRVGPLFQGRYKAVLIVNDSYLLHLSRYIHLNPLELNIPLTKANSSYQYYIKKKRASWLKPEVILEFFNNPVIQEIKKFNSYVDFVENTTVDSKTYLGELTIE